MTTLGEILIRNKVVTSEQLEAALAIQQEESAPLGHILLSQGGVRQLELYQSLAEQSGYIFINLFDTPPKGQLLKQADVDHYIDRQYIPLRKEEDALIIATPNPSTKLEKFLTRHYRTNITLMMTSPMDIFWCIEQYFGENLGQKSCNRLLTLYPSRSARYTLFRQQKWQFALLLIALLIVSYFHPIQSMIIFAILANSFYFCTILFKFFLFQLGMLRPRNSKQSEKAAKALKDKDLPTYTILIPLFQEAATLPSMLSGLRKLDYPKTKLDVKFICEADDKETIEAAKALQAEYFIEIIRVPYSLPRTKPKACNYALRFAKGDYVTIYDAEDRPEPLQLKKAIATFKSHKKDVVCLQARLNYYNRDDNILTRLFAIEYAAWFDFMLRGLEYLRIPIPLGGTSNHLNIRKLKELGEWDPFNVTEDADLGIRLAQAGYKTALLDSITLEEAPIHFMSWLKQRTRWIKGYMQTWLVHMREPISLYRSLGSRGFWGFQFFIGGPCLVFLLAPMLWIIAIFWLTQDVNLPLESKLPTWFWGTGIFSLIAGILLHSYFAMFIVSTRRWKSMLGAEVVFPFYWLLHSIASFRALWHLIIKPHHWEKTDHGLTQFSEQRLAKAAKESG